jgi:hypothetical protein
MAEEKEEAQKKNGEEPKNWFIWEGIEKTEEEFCNWISDEVVSHPVVTKHHGKWKELIAWTEEGEQFSTWNANKRQMIPVELVRRKKKVVINLMKPLVEAIESKINLFYKVTGQPNSSEQKDIRGAEVAGRLIDYNDYTVGIEDVFEEVKYDMTRPGLGCMKWFWDPNKEARERIKKGGEPRRVSGDVDVEVVPIFNIRPLPHSAKTPKQMKGIIEIAEISKEEVKDLFLKYGRITEEEINETCETEKKDKEAMPSESDENALTIKTFLEKKSAVYPKGRKIIVFGKHAVYCGPNKNPNTELGYFFFFYKKSPYSFWGQSPLAYIQPIQREFNRTVSIISEELEAWRPKMAVGQGALKRAGSLTIDAFEIVEVDFSRGEPRPINMPEVSPQLMAWRDFLISSIDRVSNIHEVSYARLPQYASRAPASLYSMMLEQENIKLDPMVRRTNRTIIEMCKFRLLLMDMHYENQRLTKIMGEGRKASIDYFNKADLNSNFDVRLEIGVSLNQSTTIQQRLLIELWEKGIIEQTDKNRNKINQLLNLGTAEQALRTDMADTEKAMRENQAYMDGTYAKERKDGGVNLLLDDDHEIHLEIHVVLQKSEEAAKWDDDRWDALFAHINDHRDKYLAAIAAMQPTATPPGQVPLPGPVTAEGNEPMIEGMGGPGI